MGKKDTRVWRATVSPAEGTGWHWESDSTYYDADSFKAILEDVLYYGATIVGADVVKITIERPS